MITDPTRTSPSIRQLSPEAQPHIAAAGRVLAETTARMNRMSARQISEAAYTSGGPSVDELEELANARLRESLQWN